MVQPFLAFVFTVAVIGVGLALMVPAVSVLRASVLPLRAKVKMGGMVAVTWIVSLAMVAVANCELSMLTAPLVWVAREPSSDDPGLLGFCSAVVVFVQLKQ